MTRRKFSFRRSVVPRAAIVALALGALGGCTGGEPRANEGRQLALEARRGELRRQFGAIQARIRRTQAAALEEPGAAAAREAFYGELRRFAEAEGPESVALLDHALGVGADLTRISTPVITPPGAAAGEAATPEERREIARDLAETERALRPFVDRAMAEPAVRAGFEALRDSLVATMLRLDPAAESSLRQMEEVADSLARLDREITRERGG